MWTSTDWLLFLATLAVAVIGLIRTVAASPVQRLLDETNED